MEKVVTKSCGPVEWDNGAFRSIAPVRHRRVLKISENWRNKEWQVCKSGSLTHMSVNEYSGLLPKS